MGHQTTDFHISLFSFLLAFIRTNWTCKNNLFFQMKSAVGVWNTGMGSKSYLKHVYKTL